jgi:23S rRNA pseudouridine1911/1915/1917 synthase
MAHLGHPLLGDDLYGGSLDLLQRQALHAYRLHFIHPITGENIDIEAPLPPDLHRIVSSL